MLRKGAADQLLQSRLEILSLLQLIGKFTQFLSHNGVQSNIGTGNGQGRTQHTELKFVTGEGQGRGTVSVGGILRNSGQNIHTDPHNALFRVGVVGAVDDRIHNGIQLVTKENRDDCGGRLVGTQTVIVTGGSHGAAQEVLILVNTLDKGSQKHQEARVLPWSLAGAE